MGIRVKQYKDGKFAIWSTITDCYIIRKTTKKKVMEYLAEDIEMDAEARIMELEDNFPKGYVDKDTEKRI